jgi:hypothetical protein
MVRTISDQGGVYLEPPYTKEELAYLERGLYATPVAATRRREPPQPAAEPPQAGAVLPDAEPASDGQSTQVPRRGVAGCNGHEGQ